MNRAAAAAQRHDVGRTDRKSCSRQYGALEARKMEERAASDKRRTIAACAAAGIAAPIVFTILLIVQGMLHPEYSHVTMPISALSARPGGWIQNLNFVISGVLLTAFAIGLHLAVRPVRSGVIGPGLLVLSGV